MHDLYDEDLFQHPQTLKIQLEMPSYMRWFVLRIRFKMDSSLMIQDNGAMGSLEHFTHLISLPRNYILIIPIGTYYASNFEVMIVSLNAI